MKLTIFAVLLLAALVSGRPESILNFDIDDIHHDQDMAEDSTITGSYTWISPEGNQFFVSYVADDDGFRIVESNAIPVSLDGVRVDGQQGSFVSLEEIFDDRK